MSSFCDPHCSTTVAQFINREPKTHRKKEKRTRERERERETEKEKGKKGGGPKKATEKQSETTNAFFSGKNRVFLFKTKKGKQKRTKTKT